jgi:hypothetical protein
METTLARAAAAAARAAWKRHYAGCPACRRTPTQPRCDEGRQAHAEMIGAAKTLTANKVADRKPIPGQQKLF